MGKARKGANRQLCMISGHYGSKMEQRSFIRRTGECVVGLWGGGLVEQRVVARRAPRILSRLRTILRLNAFEVNLNVWRLEDDTIAEADLKPEYRSLTINVDHEKIGSLDELLRVLAHEMLHCSLWPVELFDSTLALQKQNAPLLLHLLGQAIEQTLVGLEETIVELYVRKHGPPR